MQRNSVAGRIEALDYLRGFFILVIIVDHLWRWPNIFEYISGRGELWVSAAEGFVIISGLLVGYVRGRKNMKKPLPEVGKKLVLRGVMLYAWAFISTMLLAWASWTFSFRSNIAYIPYDRFDWSGIIHDTLTLGYTHVLTHFLYLYAIFLVIAPVLIWLLRRGLWWVGLILSVSLWWYGIISNMEWMQWQILFYVPTIAGFYLDQIIAFFRRVPAPFIWAFMAAGLGSIIWSAALFLPRTPGTTIHELFTREPLTMWRIGLSFVWFVALAWLFDKTLRLLEKTVGWLLLEFGTKSLTAYILHGFVLTAIAYFVPLTTPFWLNSLIAVFAILATWGLLRIPGINRVIPR